MAITGISQTSDKTLLLVAGAGHGTWCWEKIIPLLQSQGVKVIAVKLPGTGNDSADIQNNSLQNDVEAVMAAANAVNGKVILLGHSSGGVIISQAAELLGNAKVDKLIYLDAFLPQNGESVFSLAEKLSKRNQPASISTTTTSERLILSEDGKLFRWNPLLVQELFYHDCSQQDITFAKARLSWQTVATLATPVHLTDTAFGTIKKYFIVCTEAKDLDKSSLALDVHCEKIYRIPSSHSPFFSMPDQLVKLLASIY